MSKQQKPDATQFKKSEVDKIFNLVRIEGAVRIAVGNNLVSAKRFKTFKQADEYLKEKPYEVLINVACLIANLKNNEIQKETDPAQIEKSAENN